MLQQLGHQTAPAVLEMRGKVGQGQQYENK
jgi:hypothetical protein